MIRIKDKKLHWCVLCALDGKKRAATWTNYGKFFCEQCKVQEDDQIREFYEDDRSTHPKERKDVTEITA